MRLPVLILASLSLAASCSPASETREMPVPTATASASATAKDGAQAYAFEDSEERNGAKRDFEYSWPALVSKESGLVQELDADLKERLAEHKAYWESALDSCPINSGSCRNASFARTWKVETDLPRFLSLSNGFYEYTGGAHGNYARGSLLWDREAQASLDPKDMFISPGALERAIGTEVCAALNSEREKRRGQSVPQGSTEWPNQCVPMEETVVFLNSSDGIAFDALTIYYAPYTAGPYAEGDFELPMPVTQAVLDIVKRPYREAFTLAK